MSLPSLCLDAFVQVAQHKNFSIAARQLSITQSALSQRILKLEDELQHSLFIREPSGVRLSELGESLLRYTKIRDALEDEFLNLVQGNKAENLAGHLTIAAFSTFNRSILLPHLASFMRKHASVRIELLTREIHELPSLLRSGKADYIFTSENMSPQHFDSHLLMYEKNVLIESKHYKTPEHIYIDHDEHDLTTSNFLQLQTAKPKKYQRIYFDEIYAIIDAVAQGLGRAVVPEHLIANDKRVKIISKHQALKVPIYLVYARQSYFSRLQSEVIKLLKETANYSVSSR